MSDDTNPTHPTTHRTCEEWLELAEAFHLKGDDGMARRCLDEAWKDVRRSAELGALGVSVI